LKKRRGVGIGSSERKRLGKVGKKSQNRTLFGIRAEKLELIIKKGVVPEVKRKLGNVLDLVRSV